MKPGDAGFYSLLLLPSKPTFQIETSKVFFTVVFCDGKNLPVSRVTAFLLDVILRKSLEKLLGSGVRRFCQPDQPWQEKGTNGETGRAVLEDNPV